MCALLEAPRLNLPSRPSGVRPLAASLRAARDWPARVRAAAARRPLNYTG